MSRFAHQLTARLGLVMFLAIVLLFIGFVYYWRVSVIPPLYNSEQAKADLIAGAYSKIIGQAIEADDEAQVIDVLDQLTILRDPISREPVLEAISVSTVGGEIIERRIINTDQALFVSELPIFSSQTQAFIGTLHIEYNRAFYLELLGNAEQSLLVSLSIGVALLILTLILLGYLLRPLRRLVTNIDKIKPLQTTEFPTLEGKASDDILKVESAIRHLIERLNESNKALRDSEAQVRLLLNSTAEAIFGVDMDGNCSFANPACVRILGYGSAGELLGKNMHQLIHHTRADGSPYPVDECQIYSPLHSNKGVHVENEILWRNDGSSIPVEYSSYPIVREQQVVGAVVTFIDISERKKAQEMQQRLLTIIEATPDIVGIADKEGRTIYFNKAARERLGFGRNEDLSHKKIADYHPPEIAKLILHQALPQATKFGSWRGESVFMTRHNERVPVSQVLVAHYSVSGEVNYYSTIARDITEQKHTEEELHRYRDQLEELVAERTRALEASNKELESYSYSIAHDLRAPLRTIVGFSQILQEDTEHKLDPTELSYLQRLIQAGKYMAELIDEILDLARITRVQLKPATVDLTGVVKSIAARLQQIDEQRKVEWVIQDNMQTVGDQSLLTIALENLMGNAWKYSSKTEHSRIEVGQTESDGQATFFVSDNGAGFDMQYAEKLFNAFQRLHGDEFEGSGIGLATVARIIHRHGGRIWAEAKVDEGATFYFTLASSRKKSKLQKKYEISM
ncbi:MAG: PAS domain S-box protein [Gammaproteobacteria bacterium]|jgi:PAS domain S-box-containing protein